MRRLIARDLGGSPATVETSSLFDLGESAASDIAREKRRYVGEAFEAHG